MSASIVLDFGTRELVWPCIKELRAETLEIAELREEILNRAEIVSEREKLLNDLLMLPQFRERLYEMSFHGRAFYTSDLDSSRYHDSLSVGDNEQFFQVFNDHLNIASYIVQRLDRVLKVEKNSKKNGRLRENLGYLMFNTGTRKCSSVDAQVQFLEGFLDAYESSYKRQCAINVAVVSAVVLLYVVYQYLMGCLNRRGTKSYSSGSLDFRDIYVSIVLFQGAYVWIKFRQAARSGCLKRKSCETQDVQVRDGSDLEGVYVRAMKEKSGTVTHYKYEPRFKPPREKLESGTTLKFNCLSLGQYNTPGEAKIVRQIAAFYYGKDEGWVVLEDGSSFSIPPMSEPEKCFSGVDKAKWVTWKAKKVFEDLRVEKVKSKQLRRATRTGSHFGPHGSATGSGLSVFAATCSFPTPSRSADELSEVPLLALVEPAPSHGGSGAEQLADSVPGDTTSEPIPAVEHFSDVNCSGVDYNVPAKDNDIAPESDDHGKILGHAGDYSETDSGIGDMIAELIFGCAHVSPQRDDQIHHLGVSKILGDYSPPEVDGFELVEPQLSPNLNSQQGWDLVGAVPENIVPVDGSSFFFKERDPVLKQVDHLQQLVSRQKKLLEDSAIRYVDLQHQLSESEVKNSELQQENERLRARLQRVAKPQLQPGLDS
jgi:hypothetical protein